MKKIFVIFRVSLKEVWVYRGVSALYLLLSLLNYGLGISIWSLAYKSSLHQPSVSFEIFAQYFTLLLVVNQLVNSFTAGQIADEHIKRGLLSTYLLKPFSYLVYMLIREIPWRLVGFLFSLPFIAILACVFSRFIKFEPGTLLIALGLIMLGYLLSFLIQIVFAMLTFWFEDTHGLLSLLEILTILFTGAGIPIFFFPPLLKTISFWLPFQYTEYFPIMFVNGRLNPTEITTYLIMLLSWIVIMFLIAKIFWTKGLRRFTGEGI